MDANRFDSLVKTIAGRRLTRRTALRHGGAGVAAAAASVGVRASAQDATPAATPAAAVGTPAADRRTSDGFLFVQTFVGGSFGPKPGEENPAQYLLELTGAPERTIYFSDRPNRVTGSIPTQQFLDRIGFRVDAPNAALVVGGEAAILELLGAQYDAGAGTLTYDVVFLTDYPGTDRPRISPLIGDPVGPEAVPAQLGPVSLFVDQADCFCCCPYYLYCRVFDGYNIVRTCGQIDDVPFCATGDFLTCGPCRDHSSDCNAMFSSCCEGDCTEDPATPDTQPHSGC
jgi:hypothetical protein